jgi:hypothetical protein
MSMFNRLFKRGHAENKPTLLSVETAHKVVLQYAEFLETGVPLPGCVADVNQLPYPKERIKAALALCASTVDAPEITEDLKHGYLMLSAWQEGVGGQTLGLDFTALNLDEDPMLIAERIQCLSDDIQRWEPLVKAELVSLMAEFEGLKFQVEPH